MKKFFFLFSKTRHHGPNTKNYTQPVTNPTPTTRDRILDVALDLFTTQGFDGTSLRQIAERLDITKAALYYHFESKDDILMALHMRLHAFGRTALIKMQQEP